MHDNKAKGEDVFLPYAIKVRFGRYEFTTQNLFFEKRCYEGMIFPGVYLYLYQSRSYKGEILWEWSFSGFSEKVKFSSGCAFSSHERALCHFEETISDLLKKFTELYEHIFDSSSKTLITSSSL